MATILFSVDSMLRTRLTETIAVLSNGSGYTCRNMAQRTVADVGHCVSTGRVISDNADEFTTFPLFQMEDISDSEIVFGLQAIVFHKVALDHIGRRLRPYELRAVVKQFEEWICWWDAILDSIDEVTLPHV